jgi:2-amino-4-hydroxy-6-hydroxymethyldihydropteridine diphosphokinase
MDVLTFGDDEVQEPGLAIPHPRLTERAFVLTPLAEIAPDTLVRGVRVAEWCARVDAAGVVKTDQL